MHFRETLKCKKDPLSRETYVDWNTPQDIHKLRFCFHPYPPIQWCQYSLLCDIKQWHPCFLEAEGANLDVSEEKFKIMHLLVN